MDIKNLKVEAIILSKSSDISYYGLTCRTINSLKNSKGWDGNIIIVESELKTAFLQNGFSYPSCDMVFPETKFNYNKFLNIGISNLKDDTEWVLICNNDLFFTPSWWENMKKTVESYPEILSFSALAPDWDLHKNIGSENILEGYTVPIHVCGWCLLIHRSIIKLCELFDESFPFWYQDNDYACSLQAKNVRHALALSSRVYHMVNSSHELMGDDRKLMTYDQQAIFFNKWKKYS